MAGVSGKSLIRVFVAIDMPRIVQKEIGRLQDRLKKIDMIDGTYVKPELAHLTLQFIGYIEPAALQPIKKLLQSITFAPCEARLGSVGAFGNHTSIRIIWLELLGEDIADLVHKIEKKLSLGTVSLRKPFQSHITLVRVKGVRPQEIDAVGELRRKLAEMTVTPITFTVDKFILKHSTLTPEGPVYRNLEEYEAEES